MTRNLLSVLIVTCVFLGYVFSTITPASAYVVQQRYRWRNDDGNELTASWRATLNSPYFYSNADLSDLLRLRFEFNNIGVDPRVINNQIEYSTDAGTTWNPISTDATTSHWVLSSSANVTHEEPTTNVMGAGVAGTFISGYVLTNTSAGSVPILPGEKTELEFALIATDNIQENTFYLFRVPGMDMYFNNAVLSALCLAKVTNVIDGELCNIGEGSVLNASGLVGNNINWYDEYDNYIGTGMPFLTSPLDGDTTFYAEAYSDFGCASDKVPVQVTVTTFDVNTTDGFICNTGSASLSVDYDPATATANWYSDIAATDLLHTGPDFATPVIADVTTYYVVVSTTYCTSDVFPVVAEVRDLPELTLTPTRDTVCIGDTASFLATENPNYTYLWSDGSTGSELLTSVYGEHTIEVTDITTTCVSTGNVYLDTVVAPTIDGFDFVPLYHTDYKTVSFSPLEHDEVTDYLWDFGDGNTSTDMEPTHTYEDSGTYNVVLTVSNRCYDIPVELEIFVRPKNTSIDDLNLEGLVSIYPNPTQNIVHIKVDETEKLKNIKVVNIAGQIILNVDVSATQYHLLSMNRFARGNYFIMVTSESGKQAIEKLIVE